MSFQPLFLLLKNSCLAHSALPCQWDGSSAGAAHCGFYTGISQVFRFSSFLVYHSFTFVPVFAIQMLSLAFKNKKKMREQNLIT